MSAPLVGPALLVLGLCACDSIFGPSKNLAPSASIAAPASGASFTQGDTIRFQGSASDPEDGTLSGDALRWSSSRDGPLGTGTTVTRSTLSLGTHTIRLVASDRRGGADTASVSLSVNANQPPSAAIAAPASGAAFVQGDTIRLQGSATDPEDGTLSGDALRWFSNRDGPLGTGTTVTRSTLSLGSHTIQLIATDRRGGADTASITLSVNPNRAPTATILAPAAGASFIQGDTIRFQGSATDPEDGQLSGAALRWTSSRDGPLGSGTTVTRSTLSLGAHTIHLIATDRRGALDTASIPIAVNPDTTPGTIAGRVIRANDGTGFTNVRVYLVSGSDTTVRRTGSSGDYAFAALPPGTYRVSAAAADLPRFGAFVGDPERLVTVAARTAARDQDFAYRVAEVELRTRTPTDTIGVGGTARIRLELRLHDVSLPVSGVRGSVSWSPDVAGLVGGSPAGAVWDGNFLANESPVGVLKFVGISTAGLSTDSIPAVVFDVVGRFAGRAVFDPALAELEVIDGSTGQTISLLGVVILREEQVSLIVR